MKKHIFKNNPFLGPREFVRINKQFYYYQKSKDGYNEYKRKFDDSISFPVDKRKTTKLYMTDEFLDIFFKLSKNGKNILMCALNGIIKEKGYVKLNAADLKCTIKASSYSVVIQAIRELVKLDILAHRGKNYYFINPKYFFCGDLHKYYMDNNIEVTYIDVEARTNNSKGEALKEAI